MPELPDVAHFKSYLDSTALHEPIAKIQVLDPDVLDGVTAQKLQRSFKDRAFESTFRHGKFLFVQAAGPPHLVLHFGMTGYLEYSRRKGEPPQHTRLVFHFQKGSHLAYVCQRKLGLVTLTDNLNEFVESRELGPDALAHDLTLDRFRQRFAGRRGVVKSALMNQSILAGVGNVYADEILFQARYDPGKSVDQLDDEELRKLYRTMRRVLKTAARKHADVSKLPADFLLPHRDGDGRCPECDSQLVKTKISGRATYLCPSCQP